MGAPHFRLGVGGQEGSEGFRFIVQVRELGFPVRDYK